MKTDGEIKEAMDVSREPKSMILCESLTQRTNVSRVSFEISGDKEAVMLAEMREKAIMDEQNRLNRARRDGKIEVAKDLPKMGMSMQQISMGTGLTIEEVEKLKNNEVI